MTMSIEQFKALALKAGMAQFMVAGAPSRGDMFVVGADFIDRLYAQIHEYEANQVKQITDALEIVQLLLPQEGK